MTDPTRESIARYLRHVASVDIGVVILVPDQRWLLDACASWVENELDVKWAEERARVEQCSAAIVP